MGYDRKVNASAQAELERRQQAAEAEAAVNLEHFYQVCPQAREIKYQMASNAACAGKAVLMGGNVREELEKLKAKGLELNQKYQDLLTEHGLTLQSVTPRYTCPECRDTGFVDGKMCQCFKQLRRAEAYRQLSAGLPLEKCIFENFSLEKYAGDSRAQAQMAKVLETCRVYAQRFRSDSPSLLFHGGTGLGKTHLSLAIANHAIEKGFGVIYGSAQNFSVILERERFEQENSAEDLSSCDLLILDDLGAEFPSNYASAALYDVINTRMLGNRPTIISTNCSMQELEGRYGQRFASRLAGAYGKLEFIGQDIRVQNQRKRAGRQN